MKPLIRPGLGPAGKSGGLVIPGPAPSSRYLILYGYFNLSAEVVTDRSNVLISPAPSSASAQAYPLYNSGGSGPDDFFGYPIAYPPPTGQSTRNLQLTNVVLGNKYFNGLLAWNSPLRYWEVGDAWTGDQYTAISLDALVANIPTYAFPVTTDNPRAPYQEPYLTMRLVQPPDSVLGAMFATVQTLGQFSFNGFNLGLIVNDTLGNSADLFLIDGMRSNDTPDDLPTRTDYYSGGGANVYSASDDTISFIDAGSFDETGVMTLGMTSLKFGVA
jgi:hypothetical protein